MRTYAGNIVILL